LAGPRTPALPLAGPLVELRRAQLTRADSRFAACSTDVMSSVRGSPQLAPLDLA
jgi:hypothetical protein